MLTLVLVNDGSTKLQVPRTAVCKCRVLAAALETDDSVTEIPVPHVDADTMQNILLYGQLVDEWSATRTEVEREFDAGLSADQRRSLMVAAQFLDFPELLQSQARLFAERISRCTSVEEVRALLGVENDFTAQEEAEMRNMLAFAF